MTEMIRNPLETIRNHGSAQKKRSKKMSKIHLYAMLMTAKFLAQSEMATRSGTVTDSTGAVLNKAISTKDRSPLSFRQSWRRESLV